MDFPPFVMVYHKRTKSPIHAEPKQTPLMHAIWKGKIDVAKQLIGSGADIRIKNKNGGDALIYAVEYNQVELVKILLDKGANIESKDSSETTPLIFSVFN